MTAPEGHDVEVVHDLLLPVRDGVRLAANLYRPAGGAPVPCLVNYLPYHKDGRGGPAFPVGPGGCAAYWGRFALHLPIMRLARPLFGLPEPPSAKAPAGPDPDASGLPGSGC